MASHNIEDIHKTLLNQLLADSGLECVRSSPETPALSSSSGEEEEIGQVESAEEEPQEQLPEEENKEAESEEVIEEQPEIFPSPSLRKVLPDRIRRVEEQDRIHVLPEDFKSFVDPTLIPKIAITAQQKYIDILGEITGCTKYKKSLAEFWFLDTLANLLRRAQEDGMDRPSQAVLILWFCEWMKEMQQFDAAERKRMLKRFQVRNLAQLLNSFIKHIQSDNMISAARFIAQEEHLPTPHEAGVYYKTQEDVLDSKSTSRTAPESKHFVKFEGAVYECSLRDLTNITHYIFDLFSTDYQYNLVRSVFTFTPDYCHIESPFQMHNPKRLFAPLKLKPRKNVKSPKKDKPPHAKGKKREVDTEEYLALLELRARDEREQEEQEDLDREHWHRRSHILPLAFAADDEFFNKYWPPPPPEPEPEPEPETKGRKKGKK